MFRACSMYVLTNWTQTLPILDAGLTCSVSIYCLSEMGERPFAG